VINDLPVEYLRSEVERNAYNAAFYELGLRWHWDSDTYCALIGRCATAPMRIRHYLETRQPHLLKAYDANFLVRVIDEKAAAHRQRLNAIGALGAGHFDWAETLGAELGA
jgi:hypothetical protein